MSTKKQIAALALMTSVMQSTYTIEEERLPKELGVSYGKGGVQAKGYETIGEGTTKFRTNKKIGRNEKCTCGSGLKYKKCCINKQ